jgi:hypothetical protein
MRIRDPKSLGFKIALQPETLPGSPLPLKRNEVISAQVLKLLPEGKATLLIKGRPVIAKSPHPLTQGSLLSFKVESTGPFPILKMLGATFKESDRINVPMVMSAIKENLWKTLLEHVDRHGLSKEDLTRFKTLMNDITWRSSSKANPESLKELIAKSGLGWEAKLRKVALNGSLRGGEFDRLLAGDLKGMVSRWLAQQNKKSVLLKKFVSVIKDAQLLNITSSDQDRKIFLPIPILLPQGIFTVAQLLIHLPKRGHGSSAEKKERDLFHISFLLELSRLGPIRADLTIKENEITGQFILTTEEAKITLERNLPLFLDSMEEKGFKVYKMTCKLKDPEKVTRPLTGEIIQEGRGYMSLFA